MNKKLLVTAIALFSFSSIAAQNDIDNFLNEKQKLDLTIPKDNVERKAQNVKVVEKYDSVGVFYDVEVGSLLFIPKDITIGVGIRSSSRRIEAEVYAGLNAIRAVVGSGVHIPYGARVRVALNENKTIFAEYAYQDIIDFGNQDGLFENPHTLSIVKMNNKSKSYYGCGIGTTVHHAWADETHTPEKSLALTCKIGKRF